MPTTQTSRIDRNADTHKRHQTNWQRLVEGAILPTIPVDNSTISTSGGSLHVVSGGIGTTQLADHSVTFVKIQQIPTDSLMGRDTAGTGNVESITVGGGIVFTGLGGIQTTAFTGDVTKALGGTALTLATVNANIGTFNNITINAKGLATAGSNVAYLTANQTITLSGDITGSGTTAITTTLATVNSNVGTFNSVTVNAKGLVTAASNVSASSPLTTKGDIYVYDTANTRLPVGSDFTFLSAVSTTGTGLSWANPYAITGNVTNATVSNTTTKSVIASGLGLTAAQVSAIKGSTGSVQKLLYAGTVTSATALDTLTIFLSVVGNTGTIVDITSTVLTMAGTESNAPLWIDAVGGWLTDGATGTARGVARVMYNTSVVTTLLIPTAAVTTDTTGGGNQINIYAQWSAARSGNILTKRAIWSPFLSIEIGF